MLQWQACPIFEHPKIDELYHDEWAAAIATGENYVAGPYFRAPLYPAFLGMIYKVFGHNYLAPRLVQSLLGALSCGLVFLLGRMHFDRRVGAVAGFAAATYWTLIFFDGELLIPSLIVFLDLLLIWLLSRGGGGVAYGLAGVVLGVSAIARPNVLLFGPAIVVWLMIKHSKEFLRGIGYAACVTAGCLMIVLPIAARNYVVGKDVVLIASQGGVNFYVGNNPQSDGRTATIPGGALDSSGHYQQAIQRQAEQALGRTLKSSEVSDYYYKRGWEFIRERPGQALALTWLKIRLFWSRWEIANNKCPYFWTRHFAPIVKLLPLGFYVVGPLGILGLVLCWRRRLELFPLWGFVLVYMLSIIPFFCTARYRMPVVPVLILLAAQAVFTTLSAVRQRHWKSLMPGGGVLALAALLVFWTPAEKPSGNDFISLTMLGHLYDDHGDPEKAVDIYRKVLALAPGDLEACYGLGSTLTKLNRLPEGIETFRRVLNGPRIERAGPTTVMLAGVHSNLANALAQTGIYAEAVDHYRAAIRLDPTGGQGSDQYNLGLVLAALGRIEYAIEAFEQALAVNPGFRPAQVQLEHLKEKIKKKGS
jgi:tetratricopeptide (TPR) repeat protein